MQPIARTIHLCYTLAQMNAPDYFIPDRDTPAFYPFGDFVRGVPATVAARYIEILTAPGDLVIDPFGAAPNVARAALALGRRVIVAQTNPLWAWLARTMATPARTADIDAALARLGDAPKDDTTLRAYVHALYTTPCAACGKPTPADYFIHAREGNARCIARHYTCAHCGATRTDPATDAEQQRAEQINARGMHYHFAFERVNPEAAPHAERIRKLLDLYTPHTLAALVAITQKIEARFRGTREYDTLLLLLAHALDRGSNLRAAPDAPAQIATHKQFVELNLWREIETAARALAATQPALELAAAPLDVLASREPRAFIGRGSAKTLARDLPAQCAALVLTAPPTRRIALWTLAYFWGAWLLGRAAVQSLAPFLDPGKDATWEWDWYTEGLNESARALAGVLRPDGHAVFAFQATWHRTIEAVLLAAAGAQWALETFAFQTRRGDVPHTEFDDIRGEYRIAFVPAASEPASAVINIAQLDQQLRATALDAAKTIFAQRGEALPFTRVHHAALTQVARAGLLAQVSAAKLKTPPSKFLHQALRNGLHEGYAHDFDHVAGKDGFLWLRDAPAPTTWLERVDAAVRDALAHGALPRTELEDAIYRAFPGMLTPEAGVIELCARSYAEPQDVAAERAHALEVLARLGARLGYTPAFDFRWVVAGWQVVSEASVHSAGTLEQFDLAWIAEGEPAHGFVWRADGQFADLAPVHLAPLRGSVIVPEARVEFLREKLRRLPRLAEAFHEAGWSFVRAPFAEKLLSAEQIDRSDVALMVGLVPPVAEARAQLELF